jgi:hypothetical protein
MRKLNEQDLITLYNYLSAEGKNGCTRLSVIRETGLDGSTIAALVKSFPQLFLSIDNGQKITINAFSKNTGRGLPFVQLAYKKYQANACFSIIIGVTAGVLIIGLLLS